MSEHAFFGRFSGETARVCSGFPSLKSDDVARHVLGLHQRHGQAVWNVLNAAVANHTAELIKRSLPASSLLMMSVTPGATSKLSAATKHADPLEPLIRDEAATVGQETIAIKALALQLKANANLTRAAASEWCREAGYKLGKRAFERVWPQAREAAGLERIGSPGRKRKLEALNISRK